MADQTQAIASPSLFRDRDFLSLWLVSITHNMGEKLFFVLMISLADLANHSNSLVSAISLASSLPAVLFGSVAGVFVDRFSLRGWMIVSSLMRAALVLALPFAGSMILPILGFAFGFSFLTRFFDPAFMKAIPTVVRKEHLMTANSVFMTTMIAALIGSFALAGPIWSLASPKHAHMVVVGLYLVAALAAALIRFPAAVKKSETGPRSSFWNEWRFAFSYLKSHPRLMKAYVMTMTMFGTIAGLNVIAKGFAITALDARNATDFTYILAVAGLGMVLGAGFVGTVGRTIPKPRLVRIGFVVAGSAMLVVASIGASAHVLGVTLAWKLVFLFAPFIGAGAACIEIPVSTLIQEGVEEDVRGRIFGVQAMLMNLASTLPMALAGPLADLWGPAVVMGLLGLQMSVMAFFRLSDPAEIKALA